MSFLFRNWFVRNRYSSSKPNIISILPKRYFCTIEVLEPFTKEKFAHTGIDDFFLNYKRKRDHKFSGKKLKLQKFKRLKKAMVEREGTQSLSVVIRNQFKNTVEKTNKTATENTSKASEYIAILDRIRDGIKPEPRPVIKYLNNSDINHNKVEEYLSKITELESMNIRIKTEENNEIFYYKNERNPKIYLLEKSMTDMHFNALNKLSSELRVLNRTTNSSVLHLDLYSKLLLSYGMCSSNIFTFAYEKI